MTAVTPGNAELLARLSELASQIGRGQLTQPRKVGREIGDIALRLAAKPDEDGVREPLYEFSDAELRREVERRGLI